MKQKKSTTTYMTKAIPVKVDQELLDRIDKVAKELGESRSTVMRMAMRLGLKALSELPATMTGERASAVYPEHKAEYSTAEERPPKKNNKAA